jgi:palmitoyltransferase ZDHHC1/11
MIVLFVVDFVVLVVASVHASATDPADPIMLTYRNGNRDDIVPYINECLYCDACRSYVKDTSRHCKICNRCVNEFDHHCGWINNCIGK